MSFKNKKGKSIIVAGPSGSGKTTIVKYLLSCNLNLVFSTSACSRVKRENEQEGIDYYFFEIAEFKAKIKANEFLEWEEVYADNFYGTLKTEVTSKLNAGLNIIFDVDVVGAKSLKKLFKDDALSIYIEAPSVGSISDRLNSRKTETKEQISDRLNKVKYEQKEKKFFDYILINNDLSLAKKDVWRTVKDFLN
jgi:guanylate kinase